jgi:hypothetical protein
MNSIAISYVDFKKLVRLLEKEGQEGADISFCVLNASLMIYATDKSNKDITITLSGGGDCRMLPRITRTETF